MIKCFLSERKNILKIIISLILCVGIFSVVEIFLFKGNLILFSVILASGTSITLICLYYQLFKSSYIKNLFSKQNIQNDIELLKNLKFYDISKTNGTFSLITDSFDVKGKSSKCRLMHCLEIIPIFFVAVQAIIATTSEKTFCPIWAAEILFFFVMLNINIGLSFVYKNSSLATNRINNYVNDFEKHTLLNKPMLGTYIFAELTLIILGFVFVFI